MPLKLLRFVKAIFLLMFYGLLAGCMNSVGIMIQTTQTATPLLSLTDQEDVQLLPLGGSSFYYYANGDRIPLTPSLKWISVKFVSTNPAEQSAALQGSIVSQLEQARQIPVPKLALLPLRRELTTELLIRGINSLRAIHSHFLQVNPVFQTEDAEMIITDQFIAAFSPDKGKRKLTPSTRPTAWKS
jgi:hypothetical protein